MPGLKCETAFNVCSFRRLNTPARIGREEQAPVPPLRPHHVGSRSTCAAGAAAAASAPLRRPPCNSSYVPTSWHPCACAAPLAVPSLSSAAAHHKDSGEEHHSLLSVQPSESGEASFAAARGTPNLVYPRQSLGESPASL